MAKKGKSGIDPNFRVIFKGLQKLRAQFAKVLKVKNMAHGKTITLVASLKQKRSRLTARTMRVSRGE